MPLAVLALCLLGVLAWDASGLDLAVTRLFAREGRFVWKDAWVTRDLIHGAGRWLAWAVFVALAVDAVRSGPRADPRSLPSRGQRVYWVLVILASLVLVPGLKRWSVTSCPWDLAEFGGQAQYLSHWSQWWVWNGAASAGDGGPGRCFPSGHASVAFGFVGVYFLWRDHSAARARAALAVVVLMGAVFGVGQMARGAHHLSHVLWSAWLCAAVAMAADGLWPVLASRLGAGAAYARGVAPAASPAGSIP